MENQDIKVLIDQVRSIILNRPLNHSKVNDANLQDLQEGIEYLARFVQEGNNYIKDLSKGNLETKMPSRNNFMVGYIKELHAGLNHLTWQAQQVSRGDYNQRVDYFGDFSNSFNTMVEQLKEREDKLKDQAQAMKKSVEFMVSIMNSMNSMIVVVGKDTKEILFSNDAAKEFMDENDNFYDLGREKFINKLLTASIETDEAKNVSVQIAGVDYVYNVKPFLVQWAHNIAYAYIITDITSENIKNKNLERMAFKDELTGVYNRRYCMRSLEKLVDSNKEFVISMVDLDGLKRVNDGKGHSKGDEYIKTVSDLLKGNIKDKDIVARIGGDEFIIISTSSCDEKIVRTNLVNIQNNLVNSTRDYKMSISYGILYISMDNTLNVDEILATVDNRMYEQKKFRHQERK